MPDTVSRRRFAIQLTGLAAGALTLGPRGVARGATPARRDTTRPAPHASSLDSLAPNVARNLGPYASSEPGGASITDYSSIAYDPVGRRMCLFGGGHGPSQETDIRVLDLATLRWSSLYAPTPRGEMTLANGDSDKGRWISTNQPYARHSYNMALVVGRRFYLMTATGMPDHLDGPPPKWGGRICWYDFDAGAWGYSGIAGSETPWYYASAAAHDPVSRRIVVAGPTAQAGPGRVWFYDPQADAIAAGPPLPDVGYSLDCVYVPDDDRFYLLQVDGRVWELRVDRSEPGKTIVARVEGVTGSPPAARAPGNCGFAYDPQNRIIGGTVQSGKFHAYDVAAKRWRAQVIRGEAGAAAPKDQIFHCLDFDAGSGCFVFLADGATWAYRYGQPGQPVSGVADLVVTLDFGDGRVATFEGARAADQGDFVGEFVRQKCYLAVDPAYPDWRVFLRVDADAQGMRIVAPAAGWRDEVVVEYGRAAAGAPQHLLQPYTATITQRGKAVASYAVPMHFWHSRWRHQSSARAVVREPDALIKRGWLPSFGTEGLFGARARTNVIPWQGPMSAPRDRTLGAFDNVMGVAGDNPQIGHVTEYAADYVIHRAPASLVNLLTEGEWCGNWPMHIRDDATHAMPDVRAQRLRYASDGGTVKAAPPPDRQRYRAFVELEAAHFYPCANVPWLVTEDPYFLEELQFAANWQILINAYHRTRERLEGLVYPGQPRAFAWGLRDVALLAATSPASTPRWLRPASYWKACLDDCRTFALRFVRSPARIHALFRTWTRTDMNAAWMSAWLNTVAGIVVGQGFAEWREIFAWGVDLHIQQTNGTSGWPRQWPVPYYFSPKRSGNDVPTLYFADRSVDAVTCADWADLWDFYRSGSNGRTDTNGHTIDATGWDGHTLMQQQSGPSYFLHLRAALAIAVTHEVPGARACYDYLQRELADTTMRRYGAVGQARFSIDPVRRATA